MFGNCFFNTGGTQFEILYGIHISKLPIYIYTHTKRRIYSYHNTTTTGNDCFVSFVFIKKTEITVTDIDVNEVSVTL